MPGNKNGRKKIIFIILSVCILLIVVISFSLIGILNTKLEGELSGLAWSPSGSWISAVIIKDEKQYKILLVNPNSKKRVVVAEGNEFLNLDTVAWKRNEDKISYLRTDDFPLIIDFFPSEMRCFLRVADTQGKVLHTTELPIIADSGMRWSQDGRYLALAENISEDSAVIHLYNDNLVLQRSLKVPFRVWRVNWDQGTSGNLLTVPLKGNQKGNLFSIDSSNGGVKQITNFRVASPSGWLYKPSGEFYFICGKKNSRLIFRSLYCYNKNSGKITTIFSSKDLPEVSLLGNDWDQQGNRVAVVSKGRIFIVNVKTKKIEKITDGPEDYYPTFSPDGKKLAYVHNSNNLVIKDLVNGQTDVILP